MYLLSYLFTLFINALHALPRLELRPSLAASPSSAPSRTCRRHVRCHPHTTGLSCSTRSNAYEMNALSLRENWVGLESNPEVLTEYAHKMGVSKCAVQQHT